MEFNDQQAIYIQIAEYFYENILLNSWKEGERVPSVRDIATQVGVNPNTVLRTYSYLENQNIIFNKRGIGYFVSQDAIDAVRKIKHNEFIETILPKVFRTMELIKMDLSEFTEHYQNYKK